MIWTTRSQRSKLRHVNRADERQHGIAVVEMTHLVFSLPDETANSGHQSRGGTLTCGDSGGGNPLTTKWRDVGGPHCQPRTRGIDDIERQGIATYCGISSAEEAVTAQHDAPRLGVCLNPSSNPLIGNMIIKLAADHMPDGGDVGVLSATTTSTNQNGAGKSTLVMTLTGIYRPEKGYVSIDGERQSFSSPHDAAQAGVTAIHQETVPFDDLSVAENLFHRASAAQPVRPAGVSRCLLAGGDGADLSTIPGLPLVHGADQ